MEQNKKTKVYNLVILDKSGSMESVRKAAVDGCNETLGGILAAQKKHIDTQEHYVTINAFCGCGNNMLYDKTPVEEAKKLQMEDYEPCCGTPLFDAIGMTVSKLKTEIRDVEDAAVLVTIITDGYENASKEWTCEGVRKLIRECKEEGWMFSFIGAGSNVVTTAVSIAITNTMLWKKTDLGTEEMFDREMNARNRFFDKMEYYCCAPRMSVEEKKAKRKGFSDEYYNEDENPEL